ncbi:hypothetical protein CRG98_035239 [Punica granatum]|uniref:Peptidase S8/S53 domain-containing protein n=1 Tax=Punica granatum TaxID=22663 RepID=A0A2I0IL10_PUNGR|nr:hypothetical protein CRG98_035239 [Punica granatum]
MSTGIRSSKKEASASKQLAPSQLIKKEEQSSKPMAFSQPSFGQITVDSQIKTYRQTLQQEIDKQGYMQTLSVEGASFFGLANGTARGAVPSSRIAIYRVCDSQDSCEGAGILAAFDDAIADGVDIITVSLGGQFPTPFDVDSIAIGSFHAMSNGILVTHSAGNSGPDRQTVASVAPWVLTVAANTIDRKFISKLELNDGTVLTILSNVFKPGPVRPVELVGPRPTAFSGPGLTKNQFS